jgi:hypothetical protein
MFVVSNGWGAGEAGIYFMVNFVVHIRPLTFSYYRTTVLLPGVPNDSSV